MPSPAGYQPTLDSETGYIQERIVATLTASIQAIYVPADDLTDPAPVVIFGPGYSMFKTTFKTRPILDP